MTQYRYQVKHIGCGKIETVAVWTDSANNDRDDKIKRFAHECHIAKYGREDMIPPCEIALTESNPQYEIIRRRF